LTSRCAPHHRGAGDGLQVGELRGREVEHDVVADALTWSYFTPFRLTAALAFSMLKVKTTSAGVNGWRRSLHALADPK